MKRVLGTGIGILALVGLGVVLGYRLSTGAAPVVSIQAQSPVPPKGYINDMGFCLAPGPGCQEPNLHLQDIPDLRYDAKVIVDNLKMPPTIALGEVAGVDTDSKGNIYVYTRTGGDGDILRRRSAQLFEYTPDGKFMREIGAHNNYVMAWAHSVRIDSQDNIWIVDNGSNLVAKFNQRGQQLLALGRRIETVWAAWGPQFLPGEIPLIPNSLTPGGFGEPTDIAWDAQGNTFVSDGYKNAQVQKFDKDGHWMTRWGKHGKGQSEFNHPHSIAVDAQGNVYVADRANNRVQVFDNNGKFLRLFDTVPDRLYSKDFVPVTPPFFGNDLPGGFHNSGMPNSICITQGPNQVLYANALMPPAIFKFSLEGKPLGKVIAQGRKEGQFAWLHEMSCSRTNPNEVFVSEMVNYRVQKVTFHPDKNAN